MVSFQTDDRDMCRLIRAAATALAVCATLWAPRPAASQLMQQATTLTVPRFNLAATSVGTKAIFAGGFGAGAVDTVDIYDTANSSWSTAALSQARFGLAATTVGSKAIFAGGFGSDYSDVVDIFDNYTGQWSTDVLSVPRRFASAATVGNKAIFAGGQQAGGGASNVVDVYDATSGSWSTDTLSIARVDLAAATVGNQAIMAGGWTGVSTSDAIDLYDRPTNTVSPSIHTLTLGRLGLAAAAANDRAVFAGGNLGLFTVTDVVDIFDNATGLWVPDVLSQGREHAAATAVGSLILVGGGHFGPGIDQSSDVVDVYDATSGVWTIVALSAARTRLAATTVGARAIFAGGLVDGAPSDVVDIFILPEPASAMIVVLGAVVFACGRPKAASAARVGWRRSLAFGAPLPHRQAATSAYNGGHPRARGLPTR